MWLCVCICYSQGLLMSGKWEKNLHIHWNLWTPDHSPPHKHMLTCCGFVLPQTHVIVQKQWHTHLVRQGVFRLGVKPSVCWKCSKETAFIPGWSAHLVSEQLEHKPAFNKHWPSVHILCTNHVVWQTMFYGSMFTIYVPEIDYRLSSFRFSV